ncbi:dihydroorotase [Sedimentibacter saalensis]|uniref:Dihydroorotase n=1 Tax=Sedimentibacter saalensis TaxID=130788 RepID=A0A562JKT1_9FIRM|nr:dihydroorotase [Sedimentibacter saalensis]TWH83932.1 dihydroorotase [Sedimentibacter saalensis]
MLLIKNGRIIDPYSGRDEVADILTDDDKIIKIAENIDAHECCIVIDASGMVVAPGLIDVHVHFRDPGFTYKEDILTGAYAAARGGFTTVVCMANTNPVVDNPETLKYIMNQSKKSPINVLQAASITKGMKGNEIVDMELLKNNGAVGFTDDGYPIMNTAIVLKAMEEARRLNVPVSFHEEDPNLIKSAGVNEGIISEKLGMGGASHLAEDVMVARDCALAVSMGAKVNIQHVSSGNAVEIIRCAKKMGAFVTAEASPHHFSMTEDDVLTYGANAKMNPPLRTEADRMKIIEGLKDDTIEIIATDHAPHSSEEKEKEFSKAPSGITGLETALSVGIKYLVNGGHLSILKLLEKMTINPARLYNLNTGILKENYPADMVIFNPVESWVVNEFYSKSRNSPYYGRELQGKVKFTICRGKIVYEDK